METNPQLRSEGTRADKGPVRDAPATAGATLAADAAPGGGPFREPPEYENSIGRTTFDDRSSADGTVSVVMPAENVDVVPSQSLLKVLSMPDKREYVATVTAGPFCEPD